MAAAPAAEAPALGYMVIGLAFLVAFAVCYGLRQVWIHTFGALLELIADALDIHVWRININIGHPLRRADHIVQNTLHNMAVKAQHSMGYFFHGAAVIQGWLAKELLHLAKETYAWADWLQHSHLPRWVKALIYALVPPLVVPLIARALHGVHPTKLTRIATYRVGVTRRQVKAMIAAALATAGAVALPLPHVLPRIKALERSRGAIGKRLRKLEALLGATGAALLVARALGLGSARCVRSGNIGRAARRWCGLDSRIVDALLADLALVAGTVSLVELAKATQRVAPLVATSMVWFVDDLPLAVDEAERIGKRALSILDSID